MSKFDNLEKQDFATITSNKDQASVVTCLKKDTASILKLCKDLETTKHRTHLLTRRRQDGKLYILLLLNNLEIFFAKLTDETDNLRQMNDFLKNFQEFRKKVADNVESKKTLERSLIKPLLEYHSIAFNAVLQHHIEPDIDFAIWIEIKILTVAIWNNRIDFSL